jgi:hypothetical protein
MRTDPFTDTWLFFAGLWGDETKIGVWRWLFVALFAVLLIASVVIAARDWRADPAQRTGGNLAHWLMRVLVGGMWFTNTLWKLPLFSEDNGLHYWTDQEKTSAAFAWLRSLVEDVFLQPPVFSAINLVTFLLELGFAVSLILGVGVRAMGAIGVLFVAQLWLGLYRSDAEWPWTYVFLMMLMALFAIHASGRSLGLDASLRRGGKASGFSRVLAAAT